MQTQEQINRYWKSTEPGEKDLGAKRIVDDEVEQVISIPTLPDGDDIEIYSRKPGGVWASTPRVGQ